MSTASQLPIHAVRTQILTAIRNNPVTIITAETGAGKSTQVPQFLLQAGYKVVATQPRRLAARTVAARVAEEMGQPLGELVGYRTAFEKQDSAATRCLFVTDGLEMVRQLMGTNGHDVLILDEVHEWNLNIEILVAWTKRRLAEGAPFKLVLMSATLETDRLSAYFGNAPVINVPGRTFPVYERGTISYTLEEDVASLLQQGRDVLVFQPGKNEIETTVSLLKSMPGLNAVVLPLHGELSPDDQARCFKDYNLPKCIVATNIAQTSVTIPGIDAVVDSGMERRIELIDGIEGLYLMPISLADKEQRKGRAGRTKPGIYIDRCREKHRLEFPRAEILRNRLDLVVLRLAEAGIDLEQLDCFHQPNRRDIHNAKWSLIALGCMTPDGQVTPIGKRVSRMPVSVKYARMIIEAERLGVVKDVITIAAILDQGGITTHLCPTHRSRRVKNCTCWHRLAPGEATSDVLGQLQVFHNCKHLNSAEMREAGVHVKAYQRATKKEQQLIRSLRNRVDVTASSGVRQHILQAVCVGMIENLYANMGDGRLRGNDGSIRLLVRDSVAQQAAWLVGEPFDLQIQTRDGGKILRLVRMATAVNPTQLAQLAPHLIEERVSNKVRYSAELDAVVSTIEVWLNGVQINEHEVPNPFHPEAARLLNEGRNKRRWDTWAKPSISLPDPTDPRATIPGIVTSVYGTDAITGASLIAYGTVAPYIHPNLTPGSWMSQVWTRSEDDPWFMVRWTHDAEEARRYNYEAQLHLESIRGEATTQRIAELIEAAKAKCDEIGQLLRDYGHTLDSVQRDWLNELGTEYGKLPHTIDDFTVWIQQVDAALHRARQTPTTTEEETVSNDMLATLAARYNARR